MPPKLKNCTTGMVLLLPALPQYLVYEESQGVLHTGSTQRDRIVLKS